MSLLDQILQSTRRRLAETRKTVDVRELERLAAGHTVRGFRRRLMESAAAGVAVIAELKKASPSKGLIRSEFDPAALAAELEAAGAGALSVLTNVEHFQGSLGNLRWASAAVRIPCLRKDFIVDEFQLLEARAYGADAVLLIVAALSQVELETLAARARERELDVLCEVHDQEELERALDAGCDLIGVNNRNLKTFEVNLNTSLRLAKLMPAAVFCVAESGIESGTDIARLRVAGFGAFLIGESLMRAVSPGDALRGLLRSALTTEYTEVNRGRAQS